MQKAIITVVGRNKRGIIARVSTKLADEQIDVLDITQTIIQGYFNMMMIVDMDCCKKDFALIADEMDVIGT
ncbi:MAG: ACT domain-containing protein, partial [Prevotella sp.]|nr:ACT domain-containing protein [Prevotella sp.]